MTEYYISGKEVLDALRNWHKVMNPDPKHMRYSFCTFIGDHKLISGKHNQTWGWKVSELTYNKIRMLASPHHYALLKAFKARTGWQGKIPLYEET